jgi:fused signal recognition particle receptor
MTGVNGAGKTTTIGKLANKFQSEGKSVMLAAGDTFRAAAIEQLTIWGERANVPVITTKQGGDAAGLAYDALQQAKTSGTDILMIDTAGRLQSNTDLMAELEKIIRVLRKIDPNVPHASLLILDATTGQNALVQAEIFQKSAETSGIIMTKLDGTARGGVLVAIAERLHLPIHYIGVGETAEDLLLFDASSYARALVGLEDIA